MRSQWIVLIVAAMKAAPKPTTDLSTTRPRPIVVRTQIKAGPTRRTDLAGAYFSVEIEGINAGT